MPTSREEIKKWLEHGIEEEYQFMVVACDQFERVDYPIYCRSIEEAREEVKQLLEKELEGVHEVYNLTTDIERQLNQERSWAI